MREDGGTDASAIDSIWYDPPDCRGREYFMAEAKTVDPAMNHILESGATFAEIVERCRQEDPRPESWFVYEFPQVARAVAQGK